MQRAMATVGPFDGDKAHSGMDAPAKFELTGRRDGVAEALRLTGDWTAAGLGRAGMRLRRLQAARADRSSPPLALSLEGLGRFDTAGALALRGVVDLDHEADALQARPDVAALLQFVGRRGAAEAAAAIDEGGLPWLLDRLGRGTVDILSELFQTFAFYGRLLSALARLARRPSRIRLAPCVSLMERAGLDALPIVVATSFFVGATIAFLGEDLLTQFGAKIFSVELVGIGVLREFGVLVTAIILAGRSASSFAAEIGAMKMNQEVDAMRTMGVDPFDALVLPRFIALLAMTPLLTFAAMIAGLFGGVMVIWTVVGLSPAFFLQRLLANVGVVQFDIGMVKSPFLAVIIAAIGCRQGLEVGGDVEQLGRRVTTAVVQALFAIIIVDAAFALLFMQFGL